MRLLLLDQFSDPGGAQQGLLELLPAIRARGWEAVVGLPGRGEMFERVRAAGFAAERVDCGPYASGRKSLMDAARFAQGTPRLMRQIRRMAEGVDLVYVNGPRLLPAAALAGLQAPVLFHTHSYLPPGMVRKLGGISLRRLDAWVVAACKFVAEPWRPFIRAERTFVIYNGVAGPDGDWRRTRGGPLRVGCIGRIAAEKGQREFVAAAAIIHKALPECRFVIYGAALFSEVGAARYEDSVREMAQGLQVEFAGWVTDIYAAMANLDLLLVPSAAHEATTRVILEAFAAGLPVLAFPSGGIPEVMEGQAGLPRTVPEMAAMAIELLTGGAARLKSISEAGREHWRRRFRLERYHQELLEAFCLTNR